MRCGHCELSGRPAYAGHRCWNRRTCGSASEWPRSHNGGHCTAASECCGRARAALQASVQDTAQPTGDGYVIWVASGVIEGAEHNDVLLLRCWLPAWYTGRHHGCYIALPVLA